MNPIVKNKYYTPCKTIHENGFDISAKEVVFLSTKEERVWNFTYGVEFVQVQLVSLVVNNLRQYHELVNPFLFESKEDCIKYIKTASLEDLVNIQLVVK